jgi:hypothetical protein
MHKILYAKKQLARKNHNQHHHDESQGLALEPLGRLDQQFAQELVQNSKKQRIHSGVNQRHGCAQFSAIEKNQEENQHIHKEVRITEYEPVKLYIHEFLSMQISCKDTHFF